MAVCESLSFETRKSWRALCVRMWPEGGGGGGGAAGAPLVLTSGHLSYAESQEPQSFSFKEL